MPVKTESVVIKVSDGTEMMLYVARPESSRVPALLVLQEAFGVNSHIREVTYRLASEGYLAAAPELFHRSAPRGYEGSYDDLKAAMPHFQAMTQPGLKLDLQATYDWLKKDQQADSSRIGSIGFCLGGRASYLANATLPLHAAISFYGGGIAPDLLNLAPSQHGPILLLWGGQDRHIGPEHRIAISDALRNARKTFVNVEFSDADHGFFCNERKSFHPQASRQAWALTLSFFNSYLKVD